jgi:hypothetical protein
MVFILILITLLFLGVTLWLWHLSEAHMVAFPVGISPHRYSHFTFDVTSEYSGVARLPKKVYEGDSRNITLILNRQSLRANLHYETLVTEDVASGKQVTLDIPEQNNSERFLEVELQAAAFTVDGDRKQKQPLQRERLEYRWNCHFQTTGYHEISLVPKVIDPSGERNFGAIEQTIMVVKLDHLTQRHVRIATIVVGVASFLSAVLGIVLGVWHFH